MDSKTFDNIVLMFEHNNINKEDNINIHNLSIYNKNKLYTHNFNSDHLVCDVRSISKTVMTILTGIVADKYQNFDENTYIYPIIKDVINIKNEETLKSFKLIQIKHLLSHTIGYNEVLLMRDDIKHIDPFLYLDLIVNTPIVHRPGDHYLYSNAGFYLLSVVLEKYIKEPLLNFAQVNLFDILQIHNVKWDYYGKYIAGATRLWLSIEDLNKFGILLLNDGAYNDTYIVSSSWIKYMQSITTLTPEVDSENRKFRRYAYGKGLWIAEDRDIVFGHGTGGQIVAVIKDKDSVISITSEQKDLYNLEEIVNNIIVDFIQ